VLNSFDTLSEVKRELRGCCGGLEAIFQ